MPKANSSQRRTRRVRNRATIHYGGEPREGEGGRHITVSETPTGHIRRSIASASELEIGRSINSESADPWTTGFFDSNAEAFVVESPPNELLDFDPFESQPEPKDQRMADSPLEVWKVHDRSAYLDELLRHDGRAGESLCSFCEKSDGLYKCKECFGCRLHCQACVVEQHVSHPLHRIEQWNGSFFVRTSLRDLGLVVYLGHQGKPCPFPGRVVDNFTVVHTNGIHTVKVQLCACHGKHLETKFQLLRCSWLPASTGDPRTAFTFVVLNSYHLLSLQGKISREDYYLSISRHTDNTGLDPPKDRYTEFLRSIRIWEHLKLLKRSGRGHEPEGVDGTKPGQCAVECPACPHPERNIPPEWERTSGNEKWKYRLILTIDANFRMKNKDRSAKDMPALGDGWAHFVPEAPYMAHVQKWGHEENRNLCDSDLRAVDLANLKFSKGYKATGVGGVFCARHGLVRKNGLGNLQKGERYSNMDFIAFYTLLGVILTSIVFSYDIACQWFRNIKKRMLQLPCEMWISPQSFKGLRFFIPKLHIYGHGEKCQYKYSFNYQKWSARTDGEDPERFWSHINPASLSTREMTPGARFDTLDSHAAHWNWRKIVKFDSSLLSRLLEARKESALHRSFFDKLSASIDPKTTEKWEAMVAAWEDDQSKPNPFEEAKNTVTSAQVRKQLVEEEAAAARLGEFAAHDVSPSALIHTGLELEEYQRNLAVDVRIIKEATVTDREMGQLIMKRNILRRRIDKWREIQHVYMPSITKHLAQSVSPDDDDRFFECPEAIPLYLPSSLPSDLFSTIPSKFVEIEKCLRVAQADDSLNDLRRFLRITMGLWDYKRTHVGPSQRYGTRLYTSIGTYREKVNRCASRYRAARDALSVLDPSGTRLQELKSTDIRPPIRDIEKIPKPKGARGTHDTSRKDPEASEGRRALSWIWLAAQPKGAESGDENVDAAQLEIDESLRVEWAKSRARVHRWEEEVELVTEEMRRVLCYMAWRSCHWQSLAFKRKVLDATVTEGIGAYAKKQADIAEMMAHRFSKKWLLVPES